MSHVPYKVSQCRPMQYISVKDDVIEVNPYAFQLFHTVIYIWLKSQIQAEGAFMTVHALHPEAIIQGRLL